MTSKKTVGILMILAGLVTGWFGVPHRVPDKPLLTLAGALIVAGAYLAWNREDDKQN